MGRPRLGLGGRPQGCFAHLLGPDGEIYSVAEDGGSLREQERAMASMFPQTNVHYMVADFTRPLSLPPLDGIVIANALHHVRQKPRSCKCCVPISSRGRG